ncbi:hypothetical protein [Croceibacterium aestuarii]|uniref:hypothetical protein n=1 Tax=Croceibacterium aestuarii TaxID=3064139 RepID=UPI00272E7AF7|nr:hypothetical protein [Croceibacterium sp. D39]
MKTRYIGIAAAAGALALSGCATTAGPNRFQVREEARLAELLQGRVAGTPKSCISAFQMNRLEVYDHTAIVYRAGDTIWVSRPTEPRSLDASDILVIKRTSSQLCKQDVIRTVDRTNGFTTGIVFLGDFVPYTRP